MSNINKINGLDIDAASAQYVAAINVDGPLGYNSVISASMSLTASYISPTFISASAAASGFGNGGSATASLALTVSQSQAASGIHRIALLDPSVDNTPIYYDHNGIVYEPSTNALSVYGPITASSGLQGTSSWAANSVTASYALTSAGTVTNATSASYAATASYINALNQNVTINGNLSVIGTASYSYVSASQLDVGTNTISVNVAEPAQRFGGLVVYDSGSLSHQATASLFWDSLNNHWIYQNASGSTYSGGMLISGPRNLGTIGDEVGTTNNALMKGQGGDHITSSGIFDNGTDVYTNRNVQITGSLRVTAGITGSLQGTATNATTATSADQIYVAENTSPGLYNVPVYPDGGFDGNNTLYSSGIGYDFATSALSVTRITSSLGMQGTASYAVQALTASYALACAGAGGVTSIIAGSGISVDQSTGDVTITNTGGGGSTPTGSLLVTASVSLNTITFTKGDGSTFPITVDTGSGGGSGGGGLTFQQVQMIAFLGS